MPNKPKEANLIPAYVEIGRRLKWCREQHGWTLEEVSKRLGVHESSYGNLERSRSRIGAADVIVLADLFGVQPSVLLDGIPVEDCRLKPEVREARAAEVRKRFAKHYKEIRARKKERLAKKKAAPRAPLRQKGGK